MSSFRFHPFLILGLMTGLLAGCATSPISQTYRQEAKENLEFRIVQQDPAKFTGVTVIWGGRIIEANNTPQGSELVILEMPLDEDQAPVNPSASEGRFIARTSGFLDPEIFKSGKYVTVAGEIAGAEAIPLGKTNYTYPILQIKQYYLWDTSNAYPYSYYNPYYDGYYGPYGYWSWDWDFFGGPFNGRHFERGERFEHGERGEHFEHGEGHGGEHGGEHGGRR
jgi:outer membrane lipoprotein